MATFDICDGRNRYNPCPECGRGFGMGLVTKPTRPMTLAVQCGICGHRGPEIVVPEPKDEERSAIPWHERDRLAFEGWNAQQPVTA